jgi:hypothetical protein
MEVGWKEFWLKSDSQTRRSLELAMGIGNGNGMGRSTGSQVTFGFSDGVKELSYVEEGSDGPVISNGQKGMRTSIAMCN